MNYFSLEKSKLSVAEKSTNLGKKSQILRNISLSSSICSLETYPIRTKLNCNTQKTKPLNFPKNNNVLYESKTTAPLLGGGGCPSPALGLQTVTKIAEEKIRKVNSKPDPAADKKSTTKSLKVPLKSTSKNDKGIIVGTLGGGEGDYLKSGLEAVSKKVETNPCRGGEEQKSEQEIFIKGMIQNKRPLFPKDQNIKVPLTSSSKKQKLNNATSTGKNTVLNKPPLSLNDHDIIVDTSEHNYLSVLRDHDHTYAKNPLKSRKVYSKADASAVKKVSTKNLKVPLRSTSKNQNKKMQIAWIKTQFKIN